MEITSPTFNARNEAMDIHKPMICSFVILFFFVSFCFILIGPTTTCACNKISQTHKFSCWFVGSCIFVLFVSFIFYFLLFFSY